MMRVKRVSIRPEMIVYFFIKRNIPMKIIKGLPKDSKFLRAYYDANRDLYYLLIESKEFEEVVKGACISEFFPIFEITREEDE